MQGEEQVPQIAQDLGIGEKRLRDAIERKAVYFVEDFYFPIPYFRFRKKVGDVEEGTVVFLGETPEYMRGFPKIRRLLVLDKGLNKCFGAKVQAEEKLDGYNVRVSVINGDFVALTRGGLVCPYTTHRLQHLFRDNPFFRDKPELMLCGEVVGLMNPYQVKSYPEAKEFEFFVFDIRDRKTNVPLTLKKKYEALEKYGLKGVQNFGLFDTRQPQELLQLVRKLGADKREGVVLKSRDTKKQVKYTANQSTNRDLSFAFKFFFDYGQAFMFRRLVREAFQAYESGLSDEELEELAKEIGKSILIPMVDTIRSVKKGEEVVEDFEIQVPSVEFGQAFVDHLRHLGVKASIEKLSGEPGEIIFRVKRHYPSTNDKIKAYLSGEFCED